MAKIEIEKRDIVGAKGASDVATLEALFPASPALPGAFQGQHTNAQVAIAMATLTGNSDGSGVLKASDTIPGGIQDKNPDFLVHLNYDHPGVPDTANPPQPDDGSPIGVFVPAIGSPGPGSLDARAIPPPSHTPVASGAGSQKSPSSSGPQVAAQSEGGGVNPGNLDKGDSGVTC